MYSLFGYASKKKAIDPNRFDVCAFGARKARRFSAPQLPRVHWFSVAISKRQTGCMCAAVGQRTRDIIINSERKKKTSYRLRLRIAKRETGPTCPTRVVISSVMSSGPRDEEIERGKHHENENANTHTRSHRSSLLTRWHTSIACLSKGKRGKHSLFDGCGFFCHRPVSRKYHDALLFRHLISSVKVAKNGDV